MERRIYIVPIGVLAPNLIDVVAASVSDAFELPVRVVKLDVELERALDSHREQYNSTVLLAELLRSRPPDAEKVIGITAVDLFIPVLTYVFGEAQLDGTVAIASTHRLHNEYYGLPADYALFMDRFLKECLHELGHTYGLVHCDNYMCTMYASSSVEELDVKGASFCENCRKTLGEVRAESEDDVDPAYGL